MSRKTRQVNSKVATVIPEIGLDEEPISPVSREETATNRVVRVDLRELDRIVSVKIDDPLLVAN